VYRNKDSACSGFDDLKHWTVCCGENRQPAAARELYPQVCCSDRPLEITPLFRISEGIRAIFPDPQESPVKQLSFLIL
jgi:hypothetical protein